MRIFVNHTDHEVSGIFVRGLGAGPPFRKRWDDEGLVPPALVPSARVGYPSIALLPQLSFLATADQGEHGAGHNRNVRATDDFEQTLRMGYLFVAPLVSTDHGSAQHLDLRRLDQHQKCLQVAATRAAVVLVDTHLAALV